MVYKDAQVDFLPLCTCMRLPHLPLDTYHEIIGDLANVWKLARPSWGKSVTDRYERPASGEIVEQHGAADIHGVGSFTHYDTVFG